MNTVNRSCGNFDRKWMKIFEDHRRIPKIFFRNLVAKKLLINAQKVSFWIQRKYRFEIISKFSHCTMNEPSDGYIVGTRFAPKELSDNISISRIYVFRPWCKVAHPVDTFFLDYAKSYPMVVIMCVNWFLEAKRSWTIQSDTGGPPWVWSCHIWKLNWIQ